MEAKKEAEMRRAGEGDGPESAEAAAKKVRRNCLELSLWSAVISLVSWHITHVMSYHGVAGISREFFFVGREMGGLSPAFRVIITCYTCADARACSGDGSAVSNRASRDWLARKDVRQGPCSVSVTGLTPYKVYKPLIR